MERVVREGRRGKKEKANEKIESVAGEKLRGDRKTRGMMRRTLKWCQRCMGDLPRLLQPMYTAYAIARRAGVLACNDSQLTLTACQLGAAPVTTSAA